MTNKNIFDDAFPEDKQIGGSHYKKYSIQPWHFIMENKLNPLQSNIIKYICRYLDKGNPKQDLEKIKHYCDLEIARLKNNKK